MENYSPLVSVIMTTSKVKCESLKNNKIIVLNPTSRLIVRIHFSFEAA